MPFRVVPAVRNLPHGLRRVIRSARGSHVMTVHSCPETSAPASLLAQKATTGRPSASPRAIRSPMFGDEARALDAGLPVSRWSAYWAGVGAPPSDAPFAWGGSFAPGGEGAP